MDYKNEECQALYLEIKNQHKIDQAHRKLNGELRLQITSLEQKIVDMKKDQTIKDEMMASKCGWTPFNNYKVKGFPWYFAFSMEFPSEMASLNSRIFYRWNF